MQLYYASLSDVGNVRSHNEDFLFSGKVKNEGYLFIVADGMGGHSSGEVASYKAVAGFVRSMRKGVEKNITEAMRRIVLDINDELITEGKKSAKEKGMGTTLSALYITGDNGYIAHVGDSRIYRYADSQNGNSSLVQLTEDHSLVGRLLKDGFITPDEAHTHPKRNVLYQSVGMKKGIEVQAIGPITIKKGQKFLLCSDGLNSELRDFEIKEFLELDSPRQIVERLIERAKQGTASDNITVIAVSTELKDTDEITQPVDTVKVPVPIKVKMKLRRKKKKLLILILVGIIVLLLAVMIYLLAVNELTFSPEDDFTVKSEALDSQFLHSSRETNMNLFNRRFY
jgi:serine/threonine protein phosphatase PrpC